MIDWDRVRELREEIGDEDFDEVFRMFLIEADAVAERLACAPEPSQLAADFHFLKGSALCIGFQALADLCHIGETRAHSGDDAACEIEAVRTCFSISRAAFVAGGATPRSGDRQTRNPASVSSSVMSR